jgi:hypothetical protein
MGCQHCLALGGHPDWDDFARRHRGARPVSCWYCGYLFQSEELCNDHIANSSCGLGPLIWPADDATGSTLPGLGENKEPKMATAAPLGSTAEAPIVIEDSDSEMD